MSHLRWSTKWQRPNVSIANLSGKPYQHIIKNTLWCQQVKFNFANQTPNTKQQYTSLIPSNIWERYSNQLVKTNPKRLKMGKHSQFSIDLFTITPMLVIHGLNLFYSPLYQAHLTKSKTSHQVRNILKATCNNKQTQGRRWANS